MTTTTPSSFPAEGIRRFLRLGLKGKKAVMLAALLAAGVILFLIIRPYVFGGPGEDTSLVLETVSRGSFRVTVTEKGQLDSLKNATLTSSVEGQTSIISIVPEGTQVAGPVLAEIDGIVSAITAAETPAKAAPSKKPRARQGGGRQTITIRSDDGTQVDQVVRFGDQTRILVQVGDMVKARDPLAGDVVCELDASALEDKEKTQYIIVTQSKADVEKAQKTVEIQENQNKSDLAAAALKQALSQLDLRKFLEGDRVQQQNESQGEVLIAREELTQAEENLEFYKRLAKKGYKTQTELETVRVASVKAKNKLSVAEDKLRLLQKYTFERQLKELTENAEESKRQYTRVELSGLAALSQAKSDLASKELKYNVELKKHELLKRQIVACKMIAPQDGKVVYAKQRSRGQDPAVIVEGATVRERQPIISLPDFSLMKVDVRIHESKISRVAQGQPVKIFVDALPDKAIRGTMVEVPDVPVRGDWPNVDQMLYLAVVKILDSAPELKPGLTAQVEIVVDERDNVLQAPVQSILSIGDQYVAWVMTPSGPQKRTGIVVGDSNEKMVEIKSGLQEGEKVVMNPRTRFGREIAELESEAAAQSNENRKTEAANSDSPAPAAGVEKKRGSGSRRRKTGTFDPAATFKTLDKNSDGKITEDEASPQMQSNFSKYDTDHDGAVTLDEYRKAFRTRAPREGGEGGAGAGGPGPANGEPGPGGDGPRREGGGRRNREKGEPGAGAPPGATRGGEGKGTRAAKSPAPEPVRS